MKRTFQGMVLVLVLVTLAGCAAQKAYRSAEREMRRENWDKAVLGYSKALALKPGDSRYSVSLQRAKLKASADHFQKGQRYENSEQLDLAIAEFQQALLLNPGNQHATNELQRAVREKRRREAEPSSLERLKELARQKDMGPPKLDPRSNIPILLKFKETDIGKIFEAISKASGINFIFDDKVDLDKPMTIDIGNVSLEKALDILMLQTKNFYKVIDEFTLLIAPDTRQKRQEYEDQVIRTFYLSNADTKTVVTLVRSLLQSRQISENADLNSVTIKDTPAKAAIAERIIASNDKSKGEVLVDVELMEINRNTASTLGLERSACRSTTSARYVIPATGPSV
jgi:general secretion pathway protein D